MHVPKAAQNLKIGVKILMLVATAALGLSVVVGLTLLFVHKQMKNDRITALRWVVETAHGVAQKLDERVKAGELTQAQAEAELGRVAMGMRYGNNEYLFAYRFDSTNVFHVAKPELAGVNQDDLTDPTGFHPIRALSEVARTKGEGVVPYMWPKAGSDVPVEKFSYVKAFKPWGIYIGTGVYMDEFAADFAAFRNKVLLGSLIVLILAAGLALIIGRDISEPAKKLAGATRALAGGDLETDVPHRDRGDEIGDLAKAVQIFKDMAVETEKLRLETQDLLKQSQEMNAEQVRLQQEADDARAEADRREEEAAAEKRADILNLANAFEGDIGSIVGTLQTIVEEMVAASGELSTTTETSSSECDMVAASAEEASVNVQTVASAAEELTASIREISRQLADSRNASTQAVDMINSTDAAVSALADQAEQISRITKLITDIAEQTNLLALNATIEAARAGEAGRGFTVVASEVKALATQTAKAATEIGQQIVSVQGSTEETVERIRGVRKLIHDNDGVTGAIAAAVEEQGAATQEIVRNIQEAATGTADVSERIQKIQALAKNVETNAQTAGQVSARLGQTCDTLDSSATRFVTHMRSA